MGQIIPHFSYFVSFTCLHITIVMYLSNTSNLLLSKYCIHINIQYRNHGWLLFHCYWKTIRKYICVHRIINTYMYIAVFHIEIWNDYSLSEIQNDQYSSTCIVYRRRGVVARCWNSCEKNRCRSRCGGHPSYGPWHAGLSRPLWSFPDYPARGYLVKHPPDYAIFERLHQISVACYLPGTELMFCRRWFHISSDSFPMQSSMDSKENTCPFCINTNNVILKFEHNINKSLSSKKSALWSMNRL